MRDNFLNFIAGVLALERLGIPLGSFIAPAAAAGVALGVGAPIVVQDFLNLSRHWARAVIDVENVGDRCDHHGGVVVDGQK